jgi:hypothetical protein
MSGYFPDLILRSIAPAMRIEGWPRMTAVPAAILRDARLRYASDEVEELSRSVSLNRSIH